MKGLVPAFALWAAAATAADDPFADRWAETGVARLEALDKVTGRVSVIDAAVGAPTRFGTLGIRVRACHRRPPELPPDSAALLRIDERRRGEPEARTLFSGWMFSSSPSLSALEHPVYDVIVLDCLEVSGEAASASQSAAGDASGSE